MTTLHYHFAVLVTFSLFIGCNQKKTLVKEGDDTETETTIPSQAAIKSAIVSPPTLTVPASKQLVTNAKTLRIGGTCFSGGTVELSGSSLSASDVTSPSSALTMTCSNSAFGFDIYKPNDGLFIIDVSQTFAGVSSTKVSVSWTLDTSAPIAPAIGVPASNPLVSSDSSMTLSGACEPRASVNLDGSDSQNMTCPTEGTFTFTLTASTDAIRNYTITQTDVAGNTSSVTNFQWERNSSVPSAPVIAAPAVSPFYSNAGSVIISGQCSSGNDVVLFGDVLAGEVSNPSGSLTQACSGSSFSFVVAKSTDAEYTFQIKQVNPTNSFASPSVQTKWIRDTSAPAALSLSSPGVSPVVSMDSSLIIGGSCEVSATVSLSGDDSQSATCSSIGGFSFTVSGATDATRNYSVTQTDLAFNTSAATSVQWVRNSAVPSAPSISLPVASPYYSNGSSITISGTCTNGYNVAISGAVSASEVTSPSNSLTKACASSAFSFTITKFTNASFDLQFKQVNTVNNTSSSYASFTWTRDTMAPASPVIVSPASNPYSSGDTSFVLNGICESGAIVNITGSLVSSATCSVSGVFSFTLSKSINGLYTYGLSQVDLASNVSGSATFEWTRDTTIPTTPTITAPSTLSYFSKLSSLTISGTCTATYTVTISGDVSAGDVTSPVGALTQICPTGGTYFFTIAKTIDSLYNLSIFQTNPNAIIDSASVNLKWTRDTAAPAAPTKITPSTGVYISSGTLTIAGTCETGATLWTGGDDVQSKLCLNDAYSFTISKTSDATYNFTVNQIDQAGNSSPTISQQWTFDSTMPATPSISSPSINPFRSSNGTISISGGCRPTFTMTLGGNVTSSEVLMPSGSLTQTCSDAGTYNYIISKSSDGTYTFDLKQHNPNNSPIVYSGSNSQQWMRDATAPTVTIGTKPPSTNFLSSATLSFTSSESGSIFECSIDGGTTYSGCISPITYATVTNGSRAFKVRALDKSGNMSAAASYTWNQSAYKTLALYHFDSASTADSSSYVSPESNSLTNSSTSSTSMASNVKFGDARAFTSAGQYLYASDNNSQDAGSQVMTIDLWVNFTNRPANNAYVTLISKSGSASPNLGWMLRVKGQGSNFKFAFSGSINGTTAPVEIISNSINISLNTYYHLAMTWNKGAVKFYLNGAALNTSGTIGTAGSAQLYSSTSPLRIGVDGALGSPFTGYIDEVRMSQVLRWTSGFTVPTSAYTAD